MANIYLSDMKLTEQDNECVDTALSAFEKGMFGSSNQDKSHDQVANDVSPDSLRYLFAIFN